MLGACHGSGLVIEVGYVSCYECLGEEGRVERRVGARTGDYVCQGAERGFDLGDLGGIVLDEGFITGEPLSRQSDVGGRDARVEARGEGGF